MAASPVSTWSNVWVIFDCLIIGTADSFLVESIFSTHVFYIVSAKPLWGYIYKILHLTCYLITDIVDRHVVMQRKRNDWHSKLQAITITMLDKDSQLNRLKGWSGGFNYNYTTITLLLVYNYTIFVTTN